MKSTLAIEAIPTGIDPAYHRMLHPTHPTMMAGAANRDLRDRYLIDGLFAVDEICLNYCHDDRIVVGGALPVQTKLRLPEQSEPASAAGRPFLDRRELGVINVGGAGTIEIDGVRHSLGEHDGLFIPMGSIDVVFESTASETPARFYLVSTIAHAAYPAKRITIADTNPLHRGSGDEANERTIYQFIVPGVCQSASLAMGLTILRPGSVWNTLPPHVHPRRSEVYFYFGMDAGDRVFHFMGEPEEIRHLLVANEQVVVSPPWSIHMGCGTRAYAFIWAMAGENLDYSDMVPVDLEQII